MSMQMQISEFSSEAIGDVRGLGLLFVWRESGVVSRRLRRMRVGRGQARQAVRCGILRAMGIQLHPASIGFPHLRICFSGGGDGDWRERRGEGERVPGTKYMEKYVGYVM